MDKNTPAKPCDGCGSYRVDDTHFDHNNDLWIYCSECGRWTYHGGGCKPQFLSEERDVIEAALRWFDDVDQLQKLRDSEVELINKVSLVRHRRLLATKSKSEAGE